MDNGPSAPRAVRWLQQGAMLRSAAHQFQLGHSISLLQLAAVLLVSEVPVVTWPVMLLSVWAVDDCRLLRLCIRDAEMALAHIAQDEVTNLEETVADTDAFG